MIQHQFFNPGGSEADAIERPNCCLDPHPRLVFLGRGEWIIDCTHCESNLVAIKVTEPVVGGEPEDLDEDGFERSLGNSYTEDYSG